jgi:hypothetical protein
MRGYLFSALTVLMFLSLFTVTAYFYGKDLSSRRLDIHHEKTAGIFDDVTSDLKSILNLTTDLNNTAKATYGFHDRIPAYWNVSEAVGAYATFLNTTYAREINSVIYLDTGHMSSSTASVDFILQPFLYSYGYGNLTKEELWLRNYTLDDEPEWINLTLDFGDEGINDLIWLESEDLSGADTVVSDNGASRDEYLQDFTLASTTISVPFTLNYTLWVRTVYDNASRNFTVQVDGVNSTRFDIRDVGATSLAYRWFNDTTVSFNPGAGDKILKVYPGPGSTTESIDVVLLTSEYIDLDNIAPISRPPDPVEVYNATDGDMNLDLELLFYNTNYSYHTEDLSRSAKSEWNFTLNDDDGVRVRFGGVTAGGVGSYSSMYVLLNNTVNDSFAVADTVVRFPDAGGRAHVDGNATLTVSGTISRSDRIWLEKE